MFSFHFYENVQKNILDISIFFRFRSLRTASNLLILGLSVAGIMILVMLPIFLINLYYQGPVTGIIGAKVTIETRSNTF